MATDTQSVQLVTEMLFKVIGGLGVFLLGMKNMSEGMQAIAGNRLRRLIGAVTGNPISACGVGTAVTALVQSSSVTTVMVVGFVSAGLMTLSQSIGVIMGANIGTTITGWILVLHVGKWGLPILGIAAFFFLFSRNERLRFTGMAIMGVGMVFFGLELMSSGLKPMRTMPAFVEWFSRFSAESYLGVWKCVLAGCILTFIVQSSSATLGITITLAMNGIIDFRSAAALVMGENIGTTITAFLASIGRPTDAKRAAYSHIIFNVLGVLWITSIFPRYLDLITYVSGGNPGLMEVVDGVETFPNITRAIALTHSGFNVANTLLFLPLIPLLARVVSRLVPEPAVKEIPHLTYLNIRMLDSAAMGIQESHDEVVRMSEHVQKMLVWLKQILTAEETDEDLVKKVFHREEVLDLLQKEITEFLGHLLAGNVTAELTEKARMQLRMADEYESISDYAAAILKLLLKQEKAGIVLSKDGMSEIIALHDKLAEYVDLVCEAVEQKRPEILSKMRTQGDAITFDVKEVRDRHLTRVATQEVTPLASLIFVDLLNAYRRVKDHAMNIAEAVAGEK